jgi:glycosyltransferase involved in cell wall biosynthesis
MDIICHAFTAWEGNYMKSTVELMLRMAKDHRILYVDYAYTWKDFVQSLRGKQTDCDWRQMIGLRSRLRTVHSPYGGSLQILTLPPIIPVNFLKNESLYERINRQNALVSGRAIRKAMKKLGMENPVVINALNPGIGRYLAGRLNERRLVYYCYDEIGAAEWLNKHGARQEAAFLPLVDTVLVTSEGLRQNKSAVHPRVEVVKNGVTFELFSRETPPDALPHIPHAQDGRPIVGYLGSIDDRMDMDIMHHLIQSIPEALFVFVGRVTHAWVQEALLPYPNVFFAGPKPPVELPAWVQRMDVCLIPFLRNEFTFSVYPMKINEYLAAGKPVVTTGFADLSDFTQIVSIAEGSDAFTAAVRQALTHRSKEAALARQAFAKGNDWSARAAKLTQLIETA